MALKSSKRSAKKAQKHAVAAAAEAETAADRALAELQKLASNAGPVLSEGVKEARGKAEDLVEQYRPALEDNLRQQGEKLSGLTEKIGPRAERLKHDIQDDYLPRAKRTAATTNTVLSAAVGAAVEAARGELDKGQSEIRKAAAPAPKKKGRAGKVLLVLGLAAVGAAAGYVAWKKTRPVEDPWAPPADFARAHYPASGSTDSDSSTVSDSVGSAEAGDVASSLKDSSGDAPESGEKRGNHRGEG